MEGCFQMKFIQRRKCPPVANGRFVPKMGVLSQFVAGGIFVCYDVTTVMQETAKKDRTFYMFQSPALDRMFIRDFS